MTRLGDNEELLKLRRSDQITRAHIYNISNLKDFIHRLNTWNQVSGTKTERRILRKHSLNKHKDIYITLAFLMFDVGLDEADTNI